MAPRSVASPKMNIPALPLTSLFYCRIFSYPKDVDVWKKLELNPLRFDQDIRVLSSKKNILKIFHFFALWTKNAVNQQIFKIFTKKNPTWSIITPLFDMWLNIDTTPRVIIRIQNYGRQRVKEDDSQISSYQLFKFVWLD